MKTTLLEVPKEVVDLAMEKIKAIDHPDEFPEDDWLTINEQFDLNLHRDNEFLYGTVYEVIEGRIKTKRYRRIFFAISS